MDLSIPQNIPTNWNLSTYKRIKKQPEGKISKMNLGVLTIQEKSCKIYNIINKRGNFYVDTDK